MSDFLGTRWKLEETLAAFGGPGWLWSMDVRRPEAGISLRALCGESPAAEREPNAAVFALSLGGRATQTLRLCDVFAKGEHLYSRYEDGTAGRPEEGLEIHVALTAGRIPDENREPAGLPERRQAEEYFLEAVITARTESLCLERDVRVGFSGLAESVSWHDVALDEADRSRAAVPLALDADDAAAATRTAAPGKFLFPIIAIPESASVLGLLVHPAGIRPLKPENPTGPFSVDLRDGRFSLVYRLFPLGLEKGVTVRGVCQLFLLRRENAVQRLADAARRFLASPPPLTEN